MSGLVVHSSEDRNPFLLGYYESVCAMAVFPIEPVVGYEEFGAILDKHLIHCISPGSLKSVVLEPGLVTKL